MNVQSQVELGDIFGGSFSCFRSSHASPGKAETQSVGSKVVVYPLVKFSIEDVKFVEALYCTTVNK